MTFVIINLSQTPIDWLEVTNQNEKIKVEDVKARSQKLRTMTVSPNPDYTLQYKLNNKDKVYGAAIPFPIGEFSMGMVQVLIDSKGNLKVIDRRIFK